MANQAGGQNDQQMVADAQPHEDQVTVNLHQGH